ncbi:MAG: transposase [Sulfurovum sp.]|nr:MAG: transposase [Sulfurovum sp.]
MSIVRMKHKKSGVTYVYESTSYWDKEKGQARNTRVCIGKLDPDNGEILYNKRYKEQQSAKKGVGRPLSLEYKRQFYGATYLFDQIAKNLGVANDLHACFGEQYKQLLSTAYYLILEDSAPLSRFKRWSASHQHPYGEDIPSQRSSELFASVAEDAKQRFFNLQSRRRVEEEYLAYDTTSISSYSESLKQVKYGVNKDHDPLAQINLALLLGQKSRLPVCYRKLPGNMSDVSTVKKLLSDLEGMPIKKVKLVLDRGFYSQKNVNDLYMHHYKFLMASKISLKWIKSHIEEIQPHMVTRKNYSADHGLYMHSVTTGWDYNYTKPRTQEVINEKRRIYLHIYYNDQRATDEKIRFNLYLDRLEEELLNNKRDTRHEKAYQRYFIITETPKRGIRVTPSEEAIQDKEKDFGYFVLISNSIKEAKEAIEVYRSKDVIEKAYNDLKHRLNMRRTSVSSEEALEGKLFVQFVGLIFISYIKQKMEQNKLLKKYTLQGVLDEIDIIECFTQPGKATQVGEVTKKQKEIYEALGVEVIS